MSKKRRISFLIIYALSFSVAAYAQEDFIKENAKLAKIFYDSIRIAIDKRSISEHFLNSVNGVDVSTSYFFKYDGKTALNDRNGLRFLVHEEYNDYAVLKKDSYIIGHGNKIYTGDNQEYYEVYDFEKEQLEVHQTIKEIQMIDSVKKLSKTYFFIDLNFYVPYPDIMGFLKDGKLMIMDEWLQIYPFTSYLCSRYGSLEKLKEIYTNQIKEKQDLVPYIKNKDTSINLKNCAAFLRKDFRAISRNSPTDTIKILSAFLTRMDSIVHFKKCQQSTLADKIIYNVRHSNADWGERHMTIFNHNISETISSVLTFNQFVNYEYGIQYFDNIYFGIRRYLEQYFRNKLFGSKATLSDEDYKLIDGKIKKLVLSFEF